MRYLLVTFLFIGIFSITSCRSDFDFESNVGNLRFSKDTVYLDTVFTNIGSSTYTIKVYNTTNKNIAIPSLKLGQGEASKYRLMVDGIPGKVFNNIELLAKDSMFVFVETTIDYNEYANSETTFLYTDRIEFGTTNDFQKVELVTLVQDAVFIYPERTPNGTNQFSYEQILLGMDEDGNNVTVNGSNLSQNDAINGNELHWTNSKPYVIYGYAKIPENEILQVDAGVRAHFHAESGLIVSENASLQINGSHSTTESLENEVIFQGDRLEPIYEDVAGQWGTVWFFPGSKNNSIKNLTLKNATVGLLVSGNDGTINPTIEIQNTQIYNCSNVGILARTGNITGKNMVINNCGQASFAGSFGGSYDFTHCTFANYWSVPNQTCVLLSNENISNTTETVLLKADFKNCIIYGSSNLGLSLKKEGTVFNYNFTNCLIKFIDSGNQFAGNELYDFANNPLFQDCIIAKNNSQNKPDFLAPNENQLVIGSDSAAKGTANNSFSIFNDILDNQRLGLTDMGAYNFIIFE